MNDLMNFLIIILALPTFFLMLRVLSGMRNPYQSTGPTWEEIEQQHRRFKRGQARAAEVSQRQQAINQANWDREIEQSRERAKCRQNAEWGWNDGWEWNK